MTTLQPSTLTATLSVLLALLPAVPIVRRADVRDQRYLELGKRYPSVIALGRLGDATLISPRWVITAAHVANAFERGGIRVVQIGSAEYRIDRVILHPAWRDLGEHDVALIRLSRAVAGLVPTKLYRGGAERRRVATIVGHGGAGAGNDRRRDEDGRRRAATSRVDSTDASWLFLSFDAPPGGTALEGAPGPGDSGGPAILTIDGTPFVAGVSSAGFDGRDGPGSYGAVDVFTRVSTHLGWIDSTIAGARPTGSPALPPAAPADTLLPATPVGLRFRAFLEAVRAGTDSAMTVFVHTHFDEREYSARPALVPNLRKVALAIGDAPIDAIVQSETLQLSVRFRATPKPVTLELVCDPRAPHKLVDWRRYD